VTELERRGRFGPGNGPGIGGPARGPGHGGEAKGGGGYIREQFAEGNELQLRHGAYADVRLSHDPRIAELAEQIRSTQPVSHPADSGAIMRLAITYRRCELASAAIDRVDRELSDPATAYAVTEASSWLPTLRDDLARWLREAGKIEAELARTPASRARVGLHVATAARALTAADMRERYADVDVEAVES
jgi:hypothetical protein